MVGIVFTVLQISFLGFPSSPTKMLHSRLARPKYLSSFSLSAEMRKKKSLDKRFFSFSYLKLHLIFCLGLSDPFISESRREFCGANFLEQILIFAYTMYQHDYILHNTQWITVRTQSCLVLYFLLCL